MKKYRGRVVRIDSHRQGDAATVRIVKGNMALLFRIEVPRLLAANVAYSGASFFYFVNDRGATRTVTIKSNVSANRKALKETRRLIAREIKEAAADVAG